MDNIKINNSTVWYKPNAMPNISKRMFTESTEHLIWVTKDGKGKKWTFNYKKSRRDIHDDLNPKGKQTRRELLLINLFLRIQ